MAAPPIFFCADGRAIRLSTRRLDKYHRRLRLRLPTKATCWDYAPLIDVTHRADGLKVHRLTGSTAAQWENKLRLARSPDHERFRRWYEAVITPMLRVLARRPRVPENHYCVELAAPPFASSMPDHR